MKIKKKLLIFLPLLIIAYWLSATIAAPVKDSIKPVISELTVTPSISNGVKPNIIKFKVSEPAKVTVTVVLGSRVVKTYSTQLRKAGFVSWGWTGSKSAGTYSVRINATDASKNSGAKTSVLVIDKAKPGLVKHGFAAYPVKVGFDNILNFTANEVVIGRLTISSQYGVVYTGDSGKTYVKTGKITWDGKDMAGNYVPEGQYTYSLKIIDKAGNYQVASKKFTIEGPPKVEIMPLVLPFETNGSNGLDITYKVSKGSKLEIKIYKETNVIKELFSGDRGAGIYTLNWDGKDSTGNIVAPGTYTLKIKATDNKNNISEASTTIETTGISLAAVKSDGKDLVENTLDKAVIKLTVAGDTFKSYILAGNFQLNNAPQGLIISSVKRTSDTVAELTLAYTGDFDTDINNFSITAKDTALTKGKAVTTANFIITSVAESIIVTKADGNILDLTESTLNGAVIRLSIVGDTYKTVTTGDIEFVNPPGTSSEFSVKSIKSVDKSAIEVTFNFTGDFDTTITNFAIKIKANALNSGIAQQTPNITINAVNELGASSQNGSALALTESNLNGAVVRLTLNGATFKQLPTISFSLKNPSATDFLRTDLSATNVQFVGTGNNIVDFKLVYDKTTKDFDINVNDLQVSVLAADLSTNRIETTLPISITATDELQAVNSDRTALNLNEKNLDGAVVRLSLTGGDTFKIGLNPGIDGRTTGDIRLNNAPAGLKITDINRVSTTELLITLAFDSKTLANDFDTDTTNFSFEAVSSALNSGFGPGQFTKRAVIKAFDESLIATKTDGNPLSLVENNLSSPEAKIRLTLNGDTFKTGIDEGDFNLTNIPTGLTIASITRVNDNVVDLTLGYNTSIYEFDINYNVSITALGSAVNTGRDISTSSTVLLQALVETLVATKTDGNAISLVESTLNGSTIRLNLSGATFKDSATLNGKVILEFDQALTPGTITLGSINRINDSTADITINYNGADIDYLAGINMTIKVLSSALNYSIVDLTDTVNIACLRDKVDATNADGTSTTAGGGTITVLKRTTANTAVVRLVLTDDKFLQQTDLDATDFQLNLGLTINGVTKISDTVVDLYLGGNFNADVPGLTIQVKPSAMTRNLAPLTTGSITISAS